MIKLAEAADKMDYSSCSDSGVYMGYCKGFQSGFNDPAHGELIKDMIEFFENAPLSSGECCCGSPMSFKNSHEGHDPTDSGEYAIGLILEKLRARNK